MAFTASANFGRQDSTAGTSWAPTYNNSPIAGAFVVLTIALDNVGISDGDANIVASVVDSKGNVYSKAVEYQNARSGSGNGAAMSVWYCELTTGVSSGSDTITIDFGANSITKKALICSIWGNDTAKIIEIDGTNTLGNNASDPGSLTTTNGDDNVEHLWIRGIAAESNDTTNLTATAGWTALNPGTMTTTGGGSAGNMAARCEYDIATATNPPAASDPTLYSSDCASVLVGFIEVDPPPPGADIDLDPMGMMGFFGG